MSFGTILGPNYDLDAKEGKLGAKLVSYTSKISTSRSADVQ